MNYYKLNVFGTLWIKCVLNESKRQINLYDDNLNFKGVGLY